MVANPEEFTVKIENAVIIPGEEALREFIRQLNEALQGDAELRARFESDPRAVFSERGVAFDLQRELLLASGVSGLEEAFGLCPFTCLFTTIECGGGGSSHTVITHATEEPEPFV